MSGVLGTRYSQVLGTLRYPQVLGTHWCSELRLNQNSLESPLPWAWDHEVKKEIPLNIEYWEHLYQMIEKKNLLLFYSNE